MKKQNFSVKCALGLFIALGITLGANAQLFETMGTAGSSPETISTHETLGRFDEAALTYTGTADLRNNTFSNDPTSGISGASGAFNVLIQAQETFEMGIINALLCGDKDSLIFLIHKNTNATNGIEYLQVEYNAGSGWVPLSYAALPVAPSGTAKWYRRAAALPTAAHVSNLSIRFRSSLVGNSGTNPQFRIDDVRLTCGSDIPCPPAETTVEVDGPTVYCSGNGGTTVLTAHTDMDGNYQWHDLNGPISGATDSTFTPTASGSYYVIISNESGCESQSANTSIYVYPKPSFCEMEVEACSGDTVEICVTVNAHDLFFSQYVEGSNFNKYLEIYNGTCDSIHLNNYEIWAFHNGALPSLSPTYIIPLSGNLAPGTAYVVAHPSATAWTGTPNLTSVNAQWNGNDALVLINPITLEIFDIFGSIGHDPGSSWRDVTVGSPTRGWSTENKTLIRKSYVYSGILENPNMPGIGGFPYLFTEWDTLTNDDVTNLGSHAISATAYTFTITSGSASIISAPDACFYVVPGTGVSSISVEAEFGPLNDCEGAVHAVTLTGTECEARSAAVATARIRNAANMQATTVYPNPFTDAFTVSFTNTVAGEVSIQVVDMYGKSLSILKNQRMEAGTFRYSFDASALATGTYLCRIQTANGQETVRIIKSK